METSEIITTFRILLFVLQKCLEPQLSLFVILMFFPGVFLFLCPIGNCAHFHKGGWWYNACGQTNLNGVWYSGGVYRSKFQDGIFWAEYGGGFYSLKSARMMIRPID